MNTSAKTVQTTRGPSLVELPTEIRDMIYSQLYSHEYSARDNAEQYSKADTYQIRRRCEHDNFAFRYLARVPCLDYRLVNKASSASFKEHLLGTPKSRNTWECDLAFEAEGQGPLVRWIRNYCQPEHVRNLKLNISMTGLSARIFTHQQNTLQNDSALHVLRDTFRILNMILHRGSNIISSKNLPCPLSIEQLSVNIIFPKGPPISEPIPLIPTLPIFPWIVPLPIVWGIKEKRDTFDTLKHTLTTLANGGFFLQRVNNMTVRCDELNEEWFYSDQGSVFDQMIRSKWEQKGFRWGLWKTDVCHKADVDHMQRLLRKHHREPSDPDAQSSMRHHANTEEADRNLKTIKSYGRDSRKRTACALADYYKTTDAGSEVFKPMCPMRRRKGADDNGAAL